MFLFRCNMKKLAISFVFSPYIVIYAVLILLILSDFVCDARKQRSYQGILKGKEYPSYRVLSECHVLGKAYEIGSIWYPDLGGLNEVNYCYQCECVPVTGNKRIKGRLNCRDIRANCPKLDCDDPIQVAGKCCKICARDADGLEQDAPVEKEEENIGDFGALLTTRTSNFLNREEIKTRYITTNPMNIIATGRFTLRNKHLYFSFYVTSHARRPRLIRFIDASGYIREEIPLVMKSLHGIYQNATGKVCGVWHRVPRLYRKMLHDEQMFVILMWDGRSQRSLALAGKVFVLPASRAEHFTALLEASRANGAGGTAIVSTSSGVNSSIHLTLVFNGLFRAEDVADVPLNIRLESIERARTILEDSVIVKKVNRDYNFIELSAAISQQNLGLLANGSMNLIVESKKRPKLLRLQGPIRTRATCEIYQTVLAPTSQASATRTTGLAWMFIDQDGSLVYNVRVNGSNSQAKLSIVLTDESGKRKIKLKDIPSASGMSHAFGVWSKLRPRTIELLYANNFSLDIAMQTGQAAARGQLIGRPVADSLDAIEPMLLKRVDPQATNPLLGMAWLSIDYECTIYYEITLSGYDVRQSLELYMEQKPKDLPNAPVNRRLLTELNGNSTSGYIRGLSTTELIRMEQNVCNFQVKAKNGGELLLKGKLRTFKVPTHCIPVSSDATNMLSDQADPTVISVGSKCFHSNRFYDDGDQWRNRMQTCSMCSCVLGRVKCDAIECPPLACKADEIRPPREDECCPVCTSSEDKFVAGDNTTIVPRGCLLGDQFHSVGSSWYPYLPPHGFDKCAICTCDPTTLGVKCPRIPCPSLTCSAQYAFMPNATSCCSICPETPLNADKVGDQESDEHSPQGGCNVLKVIHKNGDEWHPKLTLFGQQMCTTCRCKDGKTTCDRRQCECSKRRTENRTKDRCCAAQCRRDRKQNREKKGQQKAPSARQAE